MKQFFWKACVAVLLTTGLLRADGPGPILTSDPSVAAETNSYHAPSTWFGGAEFLLWNIRDPELPNLASSLPVGLASVNTSVTATNGANQQANLGATTVFVPVSISSDPTFPNNRVNLGDHNGLRGNIGFWFTPEGPWGIEGTFFALEERERNFRLTTGNSVNQFVLNTGLNTTTVVVTGGGVAGGQTTINQPAVFPATSVANLTARIQAEALGGMIDLLARHVQIGPVLFTGRSGFRYTHFEEELNVQNSVTLRPLPGAQGVNFPAFTGGGQAAAGAQNITFATMDNLETENQFYGVQIGLDVDTHIGWFFASVRGQVGLGAIHQRATTRGTTNIFVNGVAQPTVAGGLLTGPFDQGTISRTRVGVLPEVIAKVGIQCGSWLRLFVSYNALYLQNTIRPSTVTSTGRINTNVNVGGTAQSVNVEQPVIRFNEIDTWIRGIGFGGLLTF